MEIEQRLKKCEDGIMELKKKLNIILQKSEKTVPRDLAPSEKEESPREFYIRYNPKTSTEKTLVVISFLEKKGIENITIKEIAEGFREMREPTPPNVSDKIQLLDKRGFLMKVDKMDKRHCWLLSNSGEKFLEGMKNE